MLKKVKRIKLGKQLYRRLMKRVLERDGWRCQRCGSLKELQVHHKIRRSHQGNDSLENLVTLCAHCHMAEHGQLYYAGGFNAVHESFEERGAGANALEGDMRDRARRQI